MKCEYDVIVIGSGVADALTAWKLAQLGKYKIFILEAGDNGITAGQRLQDVPNLWIVGSSVFSTGATVNPTLTIAALTLRIAAAIHRQMQGRAQS